MNFTDRTLSLALGLNIPAAGGNAGGSWNMNAENVPMSLNSFFGSTADRLAITNAAGQSSRTNPNIAGSFEGSFVGTGLGAAILGYGISDTSATNPANWNFIGGVASFVGPRQNAAAPYREGRVTDFSAPIVGMGTHATYSLSSSQVVQSGFDPETGMVWGRWAGSAGNTLLM